LKIYAEDIKSTSSPGFPGSFLASPNKKLLEPGPLFNDLINAATWRVVRIMFFEHKWDDYVEDRSLWISRGLKDPCMVFKKNQVDPIRKVDGRIIMGLSIVDQLVERFFFTNAMEMEERLYPNLPNLKGHGISPEKNASFMKKYQDICRVYGRPMYSSDVRGWEKRFGLETASVLSTLLTRTHKTSNLYLNRILDWWRYSLLSTPVYLPDGRIVCSVDLKGMKSGDLLTNFGNGVGRVHAGYYVGSKAVITNGDDCDELNDLDVEPLKAAYSEMFVELRACELQSYEKTEFSSHQYRMVEGQVRCHLITWDRMLTTSLRDPESSKDVEDWARAVSLELADHPDEYLRAKVCLYIDWLRTKKDFSLNGDSSQRIFRKRVAINS